MNETTNVIFWKSESNILNYLIQWIMYAYYIENACDEILGGDKLILVTR